MKLLFAIWIPICHDDPSDGGRDVSVAESRTKPTLQSWESECELVECVANMPGLPASTWTNSHQPPLDLTSRMCHQYTAVQSQLNPIRHSDSE